MTTDPVAGIAHSSRLGDPIRLAGGRFVATQWGNEKDVAFFNYRLQVGPITNDRQTVGLFLTPESLGAKEFLAFEYVYTRRH